MGEKTFSDEGAMEGMRSRALHLIDGRIKMFRLRKLRDLPAGNIAPRSLLISKMGTDHRGFRQLEIQQDSAA